jgi:hypothetical protein
MADYSEVFVGIDASKLRKCGGNCAASVARMSEAISGDFGLGPAPHIAALMRATRRLLI